MVPDDLLPDYSTDNGREIRRDLKRYSAEDKSIKRLILICKDEKVEVIK